MPPSARARHGSPRVERAESPRATGEKSARAIPAAEASGDGGIITKSNHHARGSSSGASLSLKFELQSDHVAQLTKEADELRAQLASQRERSAAADELREAERSEMVASYERMLAEQAAAVRQYEARAATVGTLRLDARKKENELNAVRAESVAVRQRLNTLSRVWRNSVIELEQQVEGEVGKRHALEAERLKFAEIHRKKLQSLQREADTRTAEAKKLAEREETAVQAAAVAAARQAERSYELKAKELKSKTDETIKKERSQHSQQISQERANVERERDRQIEIGEANVLAARREAAEEMQALIDAHQEAIVERERRREVDREVVAGTVRHLEATLEAQTAAHAQQIQATAISLKHAQQSLAEVKGQEKELRVQLGSSRTAQSTLSKEFEEYKRRSEKEIVNVNATADHAVKQARKEADEVKRAITEELDTLKKEYEKVEETVTRQCKVVSEQDRNKLIARHKQELTKAQQAADEKLAEERTSMRVRLDKARKEVDKKDKELRALKEAKGIPINTTATPPTSNRGPGAEKSEKGLQSPSAKPRPSPERPSGQGQKRAQSAPKGRPGTNDGRPTSPERKGPRQAFVEGGSSNVVVDMNNMAGQHASLDRSMPPPMAPAVPLPNTTTPATFHQPESPPGGSQKGSPRVPLRPDGAELLTASASLQLASASLAVHTAACCPSTDASSSEGGQGELAILLKRAEQRADSAESALAILSKRSQTLEVSLEEKDTEIQKLKRETSYLQEAANGGRPGSGRSSSPHSQAGRSKLSVGADSVVAHASVSEERAQAIKEMKRHEMRADAAEGALSDVSVQLACEKEGRDDERRLAANEARRLHIALEVHGEEIRSLESALVAAAVSQRIRLDAEVARTDERTQLAEALNACKAAEEKARELRSQLRTSEAAAAAARASAAQEQAAAAASALELAQKDKENEEKLERIVQEQKTEARSSLVQEKAKAQAESKKAVARAERDAEARLVAQRDEFAKHERWLRERIVQLQVSPSTSRRHIASISLLTSSVPSSAHSKTSRT